MNNQSIEVIPGILEQNSNNIRKRLKLVDGLVSWVQIDIADNLFVPNKTLINPVIFKEIINEFPNLNFELHMMVEDPLKNISDWISAGFKRIIMHVEVLKIKNYELKITRLAYGLPTGASIEYADETTLSRALEGRREF